MEINELYLKSAFCCMACDGDIADEELQLVKHYVQNSRLFEGIDIENKLNEYVRAINSHGRAFLKDYICNVTDAKLNEEQELNLAKIAIQMIETDNKIEYSEISFFKRIRKKLNVSDEKLMGIFKEETLFNKFPEVRPDDFLLPDIEDLEDDFWNINFEEIRLEHNVEH